MTQRKLQRCRRALERFSINYLLATTRNGYRERKAAELFSLEKTCRAAA